MENVRYMISDAANICAELFQLHRIGGGITVFLYISLLHSGIFPVKLNYLAVRRPACVHHTACPACVHHSSCPACVHHTACPFCIHHDAANIVNVESHVLRYWEEELELAIPRNEMGHRYYTEENIAQFQKIKEWKEQGYQLKAIRMMIHNIPEQEVYAVNSMNAGRTGGMMNTEGTGSMMNAGGAGGLTIFFHREITTRKNRYLPLGKNICFILANFVIISEVSCPFTSFPYLQIW